MRSVYDQLQKTLEANGLTFANVVKEEICYATDLDAFIQNKLKFRHSRSLTAFGTHSAARKYFQQSAEKT